MSFTSRMPLTFNSVEALAEAIPKEELQKMAPDLYLTITASCREEYDNKPNDFYKSYQ